MSIERELESVRQSLLDLSLRNRLLNYRPSKLRSIRVVGELPAEVYEALVLREKSLEFRAARGNATSHDDTWSAHDANAVAAHHTDRYLQTTHDDELLGKKLFRVYHEGRSAVEEQGYTVAHLALGFLEWFESEDAEQPRRAPLILVPAELERVRAGDFSKIRWTGEDVFANISLIAKLVEHGIALPPFEAPQEDKSGIDAWLAKVVQAIARRPRWRVLSDLTLDFFSFTKFVMYKDLDPATWPDGRKPHDHLLLQTLFRPSGEEKDPGFDEKRIDERLTARDLFHVMDADPSQIAVIEDVKSGRNLVVQGPPGTGKSQTITNIIAESLAAGKTVLFVSEKMAALEVVKSRLDHAGLGPFCLELHSRKSNKKAVLQELQRALATKPLQALSEQGLDEHELLKRDLNRYAFELRAPIGAWGKKPYELFAMLDGTSGVTIPNAVSVTDVQVVAAENALREIAYVLPAVQPVAAHPWRASTREAMLPHEEEELRSLLVHARESVQRAIEAAASLGTIAGVRVPSRAAEVERAVRSAQLLARAGAPTEATLLLGTEWNAPNAIADELLRRIETFQRDRATLARTFHEQALEASTANELHEFGQRATKFFRFFDGRYRTLHRQLGALFAGSVPKPAQMTAELTRLVEHQAVREALRAETRGRALFGARWKADRSDSAALRAFAEWIVDFRRELLEDALTRRAVDVASAAVDLKAVDEAVERFRSAVTELQRSIATLVQELQIDARAAELPFDAIAAQIEEWQQQTPALFRWSQFNAARKAVRLSAAAPLEPLIAEDRLEGEKLIPFFRASLAASLLRIAFRDRGSLGQFVGELHEKKIARFRELDASLVSLNRARLSRRLHQARPQLSGGASPNSEAGILLGEIHRKRGHMPIRKLLAKAGGVIQRIKPCFLMSPLSIAQFLDPRSARFDLIVFDEASQVRPEDAVGALLRGSQLVVMGDTQQLPPTSFFDHLAAGDDQPNEDEAAALKDVESILHQCARSYATKTLNWHYRSRHESLIAISNLHFYENKLRIYPSPVDRADGVGLHFVHVPRSVYDRGKTGTNRIEAQIVAAAALEHYRRRPDKSLGIGTFNIQQQQAIQEEIELQLRVHPEMEEHFRRDRREPFFVKNLETIQGDERDAILISIGFGRDDSGKVSMNFGPINQEGGERRLNVLVSRARETCIVYANFTAADISLEGSKSRGLFVLKSFLEYAQTRRLDAASEDDADRDAFEDAVAEALRGHGFEVRQRVGCAGFRVDVAVVDPASPGRYLLAVECDGPKYHESPVARDRDRLRQQILENLGWRMHRVWSTDWYRNREETIARILQAIQAPPVTVVTAPEPPVVLEEEIVPITVSEEVAAYEVCSTLRIPILGELHLTAPELLSMAVEDVVQIEGPVHVDEVVRRIRTIWGLQRAGNRIREAIDRAIAIAQRRRVIVREGDFLCVPNAAIRVRRRNGDPPARIDLISDLEIEEAVREVLRVQFATPREELIDAAARRLGIQATSTQVASRVVAVIDRAFTSRGA